jgi:hypothetical protein
MTRSSQPQRKIPLVVERELKLFPRRLQETQVQREKSQLTSLALSVVATITPMLVQMIALSPLRLLPGPLLDPQ